MFSNKEMKQRKTEVAICISLLSISLPECLCSLIANMTVDIETMEYILNQRDYLNQKSEKALHLCRKNNNYSMWSLLEIRDSFESARHQSLSPSESRYLYKQLIELKLSFPTISTLFYDQWYLHLEKECGVSVSHLYSEVRHCNMAYSDVLRTTKETIIHLQKKHALYWKKNWSSVQQNYSYRTRYAKILDKDLTNIEKLDSNVDQCTYFRNHLILILKRTLAKDGPAK